MTRNRPTTICTRLKEIIDDAQHVASENRLKLPEPPPSHTKYPVPPDEDSRKRKS